MSSLITTVTSTYRLFKQPRKIGDTFECEGKTFLILGIQRFQVIYGEQLKVWYTCQNLNVTDFVTKEKLYTTSRLLEAEAKFKYNDSSKLDRLCLGSVHLISGEMYQIMEYTEIKLVGTDIALSFSIKPIYPINRKEAKSKYLNEKKKKLSLELI